MTAPSTPPPIRYEITVRGDGTVEYNGGGLVEGTRTRKIPVDEVVTLVNEFFQARFFDALASYESNTFIVQGDTVSFRFRSRTDDKPQADLIVRIGDHKETVSLYDNYPGPYLNARGEPA